MPNEVSNICERPKLSHDKHFNYRRDAQRRSVLWSAILHVGEYKFKCKIRNFSMSGLRVDLKLPLKEGSEIKVEFPKFDAIFKAEIVWQNDDQAGIRFLDKTKIIHSIIGEQASAMGINIEDTRIEDLRVDNEKKAYAKNLV